MHIQDETFNETGGGEPRNHSGKRILGLILIVGGLLWMLDRAGVNLPNWIFTWQTLLICIGIVGAVKHQFQVGIWLLPLIVGSVFMIDEFYDLGNLRKFIFPMCVMLVGVVIFFKPRGNWRKHAEKKKWTSAESEANFSENFLSVNAILGGVQKAVITKRFEGGEITSVLGSAEINFMQADIEGKAILDVTCVLGGTKLIVPSNWVVKSEVTSVLGSVEDKRLAIAVPNHNKVMELRGTTLLGGLEIVSH